MFQTLNTRLMAAVSAACFAIPAHANTTGGEVEVLHWWTSGGEASAIEILKETLQTQNVSWKDMASEGGGGGAAWDDLHARITAGAPPPAAVLMAGFALRSWAEQGVLANLNALAEAENWDAVVPEAVREFSKHNGEWVAAPVNMHSTNWVWANASILSAHGITPPETWDEFVAALEKLSAAGVTPIAHGGQPWQDVILFEAVVLSVGGTDFYQSAFVDMDEDALNSPMMIEVFQRMSVLGSFMDADSRGRDWDQASAMVATGTAAFQMMGDWAKGEFTNAGLTPGEDILCFRFPETDGMVSFNSDQFAMFDLGEVSFGQQSLAAALLAPEFQVAFNTVKGSAPARTDVSMSDFDECGQRAIVDIASAEESGSLIGSISSRHAAPPAVTDAIYEVVSAHLVGDIGDEDAALELADAIFIAQ